MKHYLAAIAIATSLVLIPAAPLVDQVSGWSQNCPGGSLDACIEDAGPGSSGILHCWVACAPPPS